jgi:hypothetical protein
MMMQIKTANGWVNLVPAFASSLKDEPRDFSDIYPDLHRKIPEKLEAKLDATRAAHLTSMQALGWKWRH